MQSLSAAVTTLSTALQDHASPVAKTRLEELLTPMPADLLAEYAFVADLKAEGDDVDMKKVRDYLTQMKHLVLDGEAFFETQQESSAASK